MGEDSTTSTQVSPTQIVDFLNVAQRELCGKGNILPTCATLDLVTNQQEYAMPSNFHRVQAVYLKRTTGSLKKALLSPKGIIQRDPRKPPGDPDEYYVWGANDVVTGLHTYYLGLDPTPDYTTTDKPLEIFYRRTPVNMVSGGADPEVDVIWQDALVDGALFQIYGRFAPGDTVSLALYDRSERRWASWIDRAEAHIPTIIMDRPLPPNDSFGYVRRGYISG